MKSESFDEQTTILLCQKGDKESYGILVEKYMKRAYFSALGLVGNHEYALDLSQEAFIRAYRSIRKLDPERKFYTWYYQILRNLCFNYLRDRSRRARPFSELSQRQLEQIADDEGDVIVSLEKDQLKDRLWEALEKLKPDEKEIILLKDFQNHSYKEIAEILECPTGTVMSRLYYARKSLKAKLEKYVNCQ
ncbi:MAG TPA: sigma-70 family RNA polymerase sigma factor [bacterium]|nr:sigma-70 family RNA polymerase sigma factor [bacterium]